MRIGDKIPVPGPARLGVLLRHSWRMMLMLMLFALTCWEVNPGQVPRLDSDTATRETSVAVASAKANARE